MGLRSIVGRSVAVAVACGVMACGSSSPAGSGASSGAGSGASGGASTGSGDDAAGSSGGGGGGSGGPTGPSLSLGGCTLFPANHIFNTPIADQPVDAQSAAYVTQTIGTHKIHLDLGQTVDPSSTSYYGIPYNVVHGSTANWVHASYTSADPNLGWMPRGEADCATGAAHAVASPCTAANAPQPLFPFPASAAQPLVEGGIVTAPSQPYGDHHVLLLDADTCRLWELYHAYPASGGAWDIFGSATFDLHSNALRPAGWTSADAAGFPILPLLLRADEASSGAIHHALRFTIEPGKIRSAYVWPARHLTAGDQAAVKPPMGQLFRLKASFAIPPTYDTQSKAILQAMKTYGMYIADGGSDFYVQGEPSAAWQDATFDQVQSVTSASFEAVDLSAIKKRAGFDPNSAAVPAP